MFKYSLNLIFNFKAFLNLLNKSINILLVLFIIYFNI